MSHMIAVDCTRVHEIHISLDRETHCLHESLTRRYESHMYGWRGAWNPEFPTSGEIQELKEQRRRRELSDAVKVHHFVCCIRGIVF